MSELQPRRRSKAVEAKQSEKDKGIGQGQAPFRGVKYEGQFFKTRMCMFWEKGLCTRGTDCKYAHGMKELNEMPNLTNTSLCKELLTHGVCKRKDCLFAHNIEELRATQKFYKTSLCSFFRVGQCRLGAACRHAHDPSELMELPQKAPYTTEQMDAAWKEGPVNRSDARRGRKHRAKHASKQDFDDDLDEPMAWERTTTSPAALGWIPNAPFQGLTADRVKDLSAASMYGGAGPGSVASEEDDDFGSTDMWARMKTVPALAQQMAFTGANFNIGDMVLPGMRDLQAMNLVGNGQSTSSWSRQSSSGTMMFAPQMEIDPQKGGNMQQRGQGPGVPKPVMMVPCVLVPVPIQQQTPMQPQSPQKGPYLDSASPSGAVAPPYVNLEATKAMCSQLEAKLLESAMPEVYED